MKDEYITAFDDLARMIHRGGIRIIGTAVGAIPATFEGYRVSIEKRAPTLAQPR